MRPFGTTLRLTHCSGRSHVAGGALHGRWRDVAVPIEIPIEETGIAENDVIRVQLIGLSAEAADRLQPIDEIGLGLRQAALHFGRSRTIADERLERPRNRLLELGERTARRGRGNDLEIPANLARVLRRGDLGGDPLLVHKRAIQPRRLSARQHLGDQIELRIVWREKAPGNARRRRAAAARRDPRAPAAARPRSRPAASPRHAEARRRRRDRRNSGAPSRAHRRCPRLQPARATRCAADNRSGRTPARRPDVPRGCRRRRRSSPSDTGDRAGTARRRSPYRRSRTGDSRNSAGARSAPPRAGFRTSHSSAREAGTPSDPTPSRAPARARYAARLPSSSCGRRSLSH